MKGTVSVKRNTFEPGAFPLGGGRSIQLSYGGCTAAHYTDWARQDKPLLLHGACRRVAVGVECAASFRFSDPAGFMTDSTPLSPVGDRHFDGLAEKFAGSLYGGPRGALRLTVLGARLQALVT